MIARELLVKLGFNIDENALNRFSSMVDTAKQKMNSFKKEASTSLGAGLGVNQSAFDKKFAELKVYKTELDNLSKTEKANILGLNRLERQAINEVKKEDRQRFLEKQAQQRAEREEAKRQQKTTRQASLRSRYVMLRRIAYAAAGVAGSLGFSLKGFLKDIKDFKEKGQTESGNVFNKKQILLANAFSRSLKTVNYTVKDIRNSFMVSLLPAMNENLISVKKWLDANKKVIETRLNDFIVGVGDAINDIAPVLGNTITLLDSLIKSTIGWKAALAILAAVIFGKVGIIITAISLIADEIQTTIKGGDSLINRFLKSDAWQWCSNAISKIVSAFIELDKMMAKTGNFIKDFFGSSTLKKNVELNLSNKSNSKGKLDYGSGESLFSMPKISPGIAAANGGKGVTNSLKSNFTINVNVPAGTNKEMAQLISDVTTRDIRKYWEDQEQKLLAKIGPH